MIDHATAQKIKDTADIVEVVSDYVHLVRRGSNYMGLCPFHNERTPSFSVSRKRNFCYCFSCKKGGSPVNFIMEKEGLSYREALLHLAKKYGIEVQEKELTDEEREKLSIREGMLVANEWAMKLMEHDLRDTEEGRDVGLQYFRQRGVTDEAIKAFHLGYALDDGHHLSDAAKKAGFDINIFKTLGLVGTSQRGYDYDRFHGRVIFPILNNSGKVIAFGGRDLKGGMAKYINSPESQLYIKSNELYGIFQARSEIVRENCCFLVEGYMDVIGMWQSGMRNVVASSGTALTDGQIALIHRLTDNITLIYDGDAAGIKASLRGIDMLLAHKMNVKILLLPDGHDPDSFARQNTPEQFKEYVKEHATDIIRFKVKVLLEQGGDSPQNKIQTVNSVSESIAHIPDPVSRDIYIQECSRLLGVSEESIAQSVGYKRNALIQKWKKEREWNRLRNQSQPSQPSQSAPASQFSPNSQSFQLSQPSQSAQPSLQPQPQGMNIAPLAGDLPFRPLERPVVRLCLKYGYTFFCMADDENGNESPMNLLEFVVEELESDDIKFSVHEYRRIIELLQELKPQFDKALEEKMCEIEREAARQYQENIAELQKSDLSLHEINLREAQIEEKTKNWKETQKRDFIKEYPARILASHEEDDVRATVTDLLHERHQLSNIYTKDPTNIPEEERLDILVPRAVNEWKGEILNNKLRELLRKFHDTASNMNLEEEQKYQRQLTAIMKLRQQVAQNIGDRTLDPKR